MEDAQEFVGDVPQDGGSQETETDATDAPAVSIDAPDSVSSGAAGAEGRSCCCGKPRYKDTERDVALQEDLQKRLNRAIGQLNGIKRMVDENRYCGDVLTQLAAVEAAVHRVSEMILRNHLETCVVERVRQGDVEVLDEVMDLIRKFNR